jgi:hypothetical protein
VTALIGGFDIDQIERLESELGDVRSEGPREARVAELRVKLAVLGENLAALEFVCLDAATDEEEVLRAVASPSVVDESARILRDG